MAEKIEKVYKVGDRTFATYQEALKHRSATKNENLASRLADVIRASIDWQEQDGCTAAAIRILELYNVTPKRAKK